MKVIVKKKALEQLIKTISEDRSYHSRRYDQIAGEDKPVLPDAQVAMQLSTDQVPVSNPDFLPVNKKQLSSAASQLANQVSPDNVHKFYTGLKKLLRKTSEPKQHKGMSETDLMEILRPLVLKEARRVVDPSQFSAQSYVASGRRDADDDEPMRSTVDTGIRTDASPELPEPEDKPARPGRKRLVKSGDGAVVKDVVLPSATQALIRKTKKSKKEDSEEMSDFQRMLGQSQENMDAIFANMLKRQAKISLADVVVGDANRFLDAYYEASSAAGKAFPIPKSLKAANMDISVTDSMRTVNGLDESTPHRIVQFIDKSGSDRGIAKKIGAIVHTGGPIAARAEDKLGKSENIMYYLLYNFPFNEREYKEEFEKQLAILTKQRSEEAVAGLLGFGKDKKSEKDEDLEDVLGAEDIGEKEKESRKATIQKILSVANADEMAFETIKAMEELAIEGNDGALEKMFKSLKMSAISSDEYNRMSVDEKSNLKDQIKNVYDSNRKAFYDISHMDYVRDILDWDEFSTKYSEEGGLIISSDQTALAEEQLLEAFFEKCFKPRMEKALSEIASQYPTTKPAISATYDSKLSDYDSFVTSGLEVEPYKDLVNEITKNYIINNQAVFKKTIPDFYNMLAGVKGKQGTEEYDARLAAIGMKEIGRQREPFEYLRSVTATMKAVTASALLEILEGRKELDQTGRTAEEIEKAFRSKLARAKQSPEAAEEIMYDKIMNKILRAADIKNFSDLLSADVDSIMSDLKSKNIFTRTEKALKQEIDLDDPEIQEHIFSVVQKFINKMSEHFDKLGKEGSLAERGPVYKFIGEYALQVKGEDDSIGAGELADLLQDYSEMTMEAAEEAQKEKKKQAKKGK